jgi:heme-degrading monooxygenase HmoA
MIERHLTFNVYKDKKEEFKKVFVEEYGPAMAVMLGLIRVDLLVNRPDQLSQYQMVIRFESAETAVDWHSSAAHQL